MGKRFWWQMVGIAVGVGLLMILAVLVLGRLYYRFGAMGALLVVFGVAMLFAYRHDRKKQREYEELP